MASNKKPIPNFSKTPVKAAPAKVSPVVTSTPVRNSAVPKAKTVAKPQITREMIAIRAYEIHCGGTGGSQDDNWFRAERELRGGL